MTLAEPRAHSAHHREIVESLATPRAAALVAVATLTVVAVVLRASELHQSLLGDEVYTYGDVVGRSLGGVFSRLHGALEDNPPLYFVLAWGSVKLGDPTVWMRLPSVVLGAAVVPVVYALGREVFGRIAGLIGAVVLALAPFAVYYGIEARPYATLIFFVALSTLALVRAVATRSRWWWLLYALAAASAAYSHYTSIFVLGVQAAWSLWVCRDRLREPVLANALVLLLYVPWFSHLHGKDLGAYARWYPLRVERVLTDLLRPVPGHPAAPLRAIPTILGLVALGLCLAGGAWAWISQSRQSNRLGRQRPSAVVILIASLAAATPVGLLLYSLIGTDIWLPRGLSASLPAIALVLGGVMAALPLRIALAAAAVTVITLTAGTLRSFDASYARGPYRAIAQYLDRAAGPRDPITIVSINGGPAIPIQTHKPHHIAPTTAALWQSVAPGGSAYLILDDAFAHALHITAPHPNGFTLVRHKHYAGSFPTDVLVYRRGSAR